MFWQGTSFDTLFSEVGKYGLQSIHCAEVRDHDTDGLRNVEGKLLQIRVRIQLWGLNISEREQLLDFWLEFEDILKEDNSNSL